ncbi:cation:proton antiporter [Polyangium spumosum]|nr:cation:proton antiporter [Polyangium spumosum]
MEQIPILRDLAIISIVGVVVVLLLGRVRLPAVAGLLLAGAFLGPTGFGLLSDAHRIQSLAEIGVVLLLFGIGLEFSLERLRQIAKTVTIGGSLQVGLTILAAVLCARVAGEPFSRGVLFGFLFALSSTALVLRTLAERGEVDAPHGRFIVGALIFQDLCVVPMVLVIPILAGRSGGDPTRDLALALGKAALLVLVTVVVARSLVPRFFAMVDRARSRELFLMAVLGICLATAFLTSLAGLSLALGAFLAGILLAGSEYAHRAIGDVLPLRHAFTSLFFVSLGMLLDVHVLVEEPISVGLYLAAFVLGKGFIATLSALSMRFPARVAWLAGVGLAQFGEFGFVLATLAERNGLITPAEDRALLAAGVLSMIITPLAMHLAPRVRAGEKILKPLERLLGARGIDEPMPEHSALSEHVIIVGYGVAGRMLARALAETHVPYLVLELNAETVRAAREAGEPAYYADVTSPEALANARVEHAAALVLLINDPEATRRAVAAAKRSAPEIPVLVRAHYIAADRALADLGADEVVFEELEAGLEMIARVLRRRAVPRNVIIERVNVARRDSKGLFVRKPTLQRPTLAELHELGELKVETFLVRSGSFACGKSPLDLDLRRKTGASLVAIRRGGSLCEDVTPSAPLREDDVLYLVGKLVSIEGAVRLLDEGD